MEITGKVIAALEPKGGISKASGNPWKMQDYVIETNEQYPRRMCFNVFGEDKINQFNIQVGEEITVSFDINAREYQGRWFNDIRAWKVERGTPEQQAAPIPTDEVPVVEAPTAPMPTSESEESNDDLPF